MTTIYYVSVVIVVISLVQSSHSDLSVSLDEYPGLNDVCGDIITLHPGNTSVVTATGRVKNGACGVMYRALSTEDRKCKEICVTLKTEQLETCDVKIVFSAFVFSRFTSDEVRIFDCRNKDVIKGQWCPTADQLKVEVVESPDYALRWTDSKLYSFRAEVSAHFEDFHKIDTDAYLHTRYNKEARDREYQNRVEGIVVAVCLAAIFLVLMAVMYCYYRHKAVENPHQEVAYVDFTGVQVKKRPIMKTLRSKLHLKPHRRRMSSVGVEPPSREVRYDNRSDGSPRMGTPSDLHDSDPASGSAVTMEIEQKTKFLESDQI